MLGIVKIVAAGLVCCAAGLAQAPERRPEFEVASVKAAPPPGPNMQPRLIKGGPGSSDPGAATFQNVDLFSIIGMAYGIRSYQLTGPDWLKTARFDIAAKLPPGCTVEQYRLMLQSLLASRFHLQAHFEKREGQVYEMTIGKGGMKLKEAPADAPSAEDGLQPPAFSSPPMGRTMGTSVMLQKTSMEKLAGFLSGQIGQPVVDATGLTGRYDGRLSWIGGGESAPGLAPTSPFDALEEQVGLKLTARKAPIDLLVVDKVEKIPTEN